MRSGGRGSCHRHPHQTMSMIESIIAVAVSAVTAVSLPAAVVDLDRAEICMESDCRPVLIGKATPRGEYPLQLAKTDEAGYGGDVLVFKQDDTGAYAVHRIWTQRPSEKRLERIQQDTARRIITNGCVNVSDEVYELLKQHRVVIIK